MKEQYSSMDSSDEELEKNIIQGNYLNCLLTNILNIKYVYTSDGFKIQLGLILHNLADRLFRSSAINNLYQKIKAQKLSLTENTHKKILSDIKVAFNKKLNQLFTDDNKENKPADKDYIQLFNFLFNKKIHLPEIFTLKKNINIVDAREVLLKELQTSYIKFTPLFKNPIIFDLEGHNPGEILACSQTVIRNNKNKIKHSTIAKANNYNSSTIYNLPNMQQVLYSFRLP